MSEIYRLSKTPSETGQVRGEVNASVLDVVDTRFDIDEKEETLGRRKRSRSDSKKKVKKFKMMFQLFLLMKWRLRRSRLLR